MRFAIATVAVAARPILQENDASTVDTAAILNGTRLFLDFLDRIDSPFGHLARPIAFVVSQATIRHHLRPACTPILQRTVFASLVPCRRFQERRSKEDNIRR